MGMLVKLNDNLVIDADLVVGLKIVDRSNEDEVENNHKYELKVQLDEPQPSIWHTVYFNSYEYSVTDRMNELQKELNLARTRA